MDQRAEEPQDKDFDAAWEDISRQLEAEFAADSETTTAPPQNLPPHTPASPEDNAQRQLTGEPQTTTAPGKFTPAFADAVSHTENFAPRPAGPRDWNPAPEDLEDVPFADGHDPETFASYNPPPAPTHPAAPWLWGGSGLAGVLAILCLLGYLPYGTFGAAVCALVALGLVGAAVVCTSPAREDTDPFDDGARL
ncbi:hypothetical protein [Actinobaculum suis]|uniref:hypothetical protein n=1 Tax=Actinobaculum suis TaxID=1657 RepID=UPI00066FCD27|nr:hypothetical protein [Actinobaculum suis]KMY22876.1 hypothetical protein ACU19_07665 [Actinobaculum suis]OCA93920.1 hypothetical protein ACU20_07245 [Actinobaculum suis]